MKFYTASSFKNIESVRNINQELQRIGYIHTYDWTQNDRASSREELERIGREEKRAVMESDFIIVLLPAGKGSHIELGIALGLGKKVFLYSLENADLASTSTFYHLPEVEQCFGSLDDLLGKVAAFQHI
ncbi:group-specific protein [Rossellomorea vietnamensis]|uniref:Group-specific protein n=1 Tax=Rossellomorea vietnamensis TaxID=218284 RepID=A0A5D4NPT5_9BACI|nr:nucleoside 2-deoxyribosyltransferase [Rossellomorea vietnamensis]TYS16167.1 group-specific protein [Rossellomorea vietnamensis]